MKPTDKTAQKILLLAVPFVTGTAIAALPAQAATFSLSAADAQVDRFSLPTSDVAVFTDTNTNTLAVDGFVQADANAFATLSNQAGLNISSSQAGGEGVQYTGAANSVAQVIGSFFVSTGDAFSFRFNANLALQASADNPQFETASAFGNIVFRLFDSQTESLLDSFELAGLLDSKSSGDPFRFDAGKSVQATLTTALLADGTYTAQVEGVYSRSFDAGTYLKLEETKTNGVQVAGVPEPSEIVGSVLALALGCGVMYRRSRRPKAALHLTK